MGRTLVILLVGRTGALFLFAEFFINFSVKPVGLCLAFLAQHFLEPFHFLTVYLNGKRFEFGAPIFEVLGSALWRQPLTSLLRATLYRVAGNKSSKYLGAPF